MRARSQLPRGAQVSELLHTIYSGEARTDLVARLQFNEQSMGFDAPISFEYLEKHAQSGAFLRLEWDGDDARPLRYTGTGAAPIGAAVRANFLGALAFSFGALPRWNATRLV